MPTIIDAVETQALIGALTTAFGFYFKFGIITKPLSESSQLWDELLSTIRQHISSGLKDLLENSLKESNDVTQILLPSGGDYAELEQKPFQGERFKNELSSYVKDYGADVLADYRVAQQYRCSWSHLISRIANWLLITGSIEILALLSIFIGEYLWPQANDDWHKFTLIVIPVQAVVLIVLLGMLHTHHDRLSLLKVKYDVS